MSSQPDPPFQMPKMPWPLRPLDWFFSRIADRTIAATESSVKDVRRYRRVHRWMLLRVLVVFGASAAIVFSTDIPWWGMLGWFVIVYFAYTGANSNFLRGRSYMNGWLDGRSAMIASLQEAVVHRSMDLPEWLQGEYERDTMVLLNAYGVRGDD